VQFLGASELDSQLVGTLHRVLGDLLAGLWLEVIDSFVCHVYECSSEICMYYLYAVVLRILYGTFV
jgi:hypothetical protein